MRPMFLLVATTILFSSPSFAGTVVYCECRWSDGANALAGYLKGLDMQSGELKWEKLIRTFGDPAKVPGASEKCQSFEERCPISSRD